MSFESLGLSEPIVRAVAERGYTIPTPIQAQAIPAVLSGGDLLAGAQTGTGKTAGFTLPILQRLMQKPVVRTTRSTPPVRVLILVPTRELAAQVQESVRDYGKHLPIASTTVFGGVSINPQIATLRKGVDILVATPGRLLDHLQQKTVDLSRVEILVLDEADRMLDMGFIRDIKRILALLPKQRQNLLFSATFSDEIKTLADGLLNRPAMIEVARRNSTTDLVEHKVVMVEKGHKRGVLSHLIRSGDWHQVLVFTRTKHGANRLAEQLCKDDIRSLAIHGNKSQNARTRALAEFKEGSLRVLVATDIAARGLDIVELPHVVNYELPNVPEDYVHRIGRTGRAGSTGEAWALVGADERVFLRDIERLIKRELPRVQVEGFVPSAPDVEPPDTSRDRPRTHGRSNGQGPSSNSRGKTGQRAAPAKRSSHGPRPAQSSDGTPPPGFECPQSFGSRTPTCNQPRNDSVDYLGISTGRTTQQIERRGRTVDRRIQSRAGQNVRKFQEARVTGMKPLSLLATLVFTALATTFAFAQAPIRVEQAWVRGTVEGQQSTGAYMTITSASNAKLVGVSTKIAKVVEVHEMVMSNGVMGMRALPKLEVKAGTPTTLAPNGAHVMLMGLTQPLKPGDKVPLVLTFEGSTGQRTTLHVDAEVRPINR